MAKAPTKKLSNGLKMPIIGLGTYALELDLVHGGEVVLTNPASVKASGGPKNKDCQRSVEAAIECGYRHIDTAAFYQNENEVGDAVTNMIQKGIVTREELFITTKLWNDRHEFSKVEPTLRESLANLNLEYVDLYLIHWPLAINEDSSDNNDLDYLDTWRGMEKCLDLGLVKSIGVSNFNMQQLERLLSNCKVPPVVNQVEININNTQRKLIAYCVSKEIVVTAYSPFGSITARRSTSTSPPPRIDDPILTDIAIKYKKTTTQIVLRFLVQLGCTVIPKSITPARIAQNIDIFDFKLTFEEMKSLDIFNKDFRVVPCLFWKNNKHYPF